MRRPGLTGWILIAVVVGVAVGGLFRVLAPETFAAEPAELQGAPAAIRMVLELAEKLFLRLLRMIIVPLIFTSIVSGVLSAGDTRGIGRLGIKTIAYYVSTSTLAILTGLVLVNVIRPGSGGAAIPLEEVPEGFQAVEQTPLEFLVDFVLGLVPRNPIAAMVEGEVLQIIVFALLVGIFVRQVPDPFRTTLSELFQGGFEVMMRIVRLVLWFAPAGIFALIVGIVASADLEAFRSLALYAFTVLLALVIHATVTLPVILRFFARASPCRHVRVMAPALLTAFSTASSSGTLAVTMECVEDRAKVSNRVTSFVLPMGATVNMDGTALYECVAAVFIAQIYVAQGAIAPLSFEQQLLVVVTALAASIGAAGIPMAGLVMIGIILEAIGLPLEAIGYILVVDRILDMCRTTVNVWSDSCGAVVIAYSEGEREFLPDLSSTPDDAETDQGA